MVKRRKGDAIFRSNRLTNDHFVHVVELVPILVVRIDVFDQGFEFWAAGNGDVQRFGGEK